MTEKRDDANRQAAIRVARLSPLPDMARAKHDARTLHITFRYELTEAEIQSFSKYVANWEFVQ